jgi:hypothetical protein
MDTALTWFIRIWIVIGVALNIAGAGLAMTDSKWKALEIFRPFSMVNLAAEIIVFSPAFLAYSWREKRRAKSRPARAAPHAELRRDTRSAERDDKAGLRGDTRSAERDHKARLRGDTRVAEFDEQVERIFENFPPKRPI